MKNLFFVFVLAPFIFIASCSSDKDDDKGPKYEFIDQDIQGVINGQQWAVSSGTASEGFEANEMWIELSDLFYEDPCSEFFIDGLQVFFTVEKTVGLYEMFIDLNSFDGQTITLYDPEGSINIIITEGALEITSITATQVSGRIDGKFDNDNYVNGSFTVPYCSTE